MELPGDLNTSPFAELAQDFAGLGQVKNVEPSFISYTLHPHSKLIIDLIQKVILSIDFKTNNLLLYIRYICKLNQNNQ